MSSGSNCHWDVPWNADNKHNRTPALYVFICKGLAWHGATETNYTQYSQNYEKWKKYNYQFSSMTAVCSKYGRVDILVEVNE